MSEMQVQADTLKEEAKQLLTQMLYPGLSPGGGSGSVDRFVDCVVSAAMLEICAAQAAVTKGQP